MFIYPCWHRYFTSLSIFFLILYSSFSYGADECNSTAQCRTLWGSTATDCFNSRSDASICLCGESSCASIFNAPASDAPSVNFDTPVDGATITAGDGLYVNVLATDNDGIANVRLSLNGNFIRQENVSLYQWGNNGKDAALQDLPVGTHQLTATATDNQGQSASVSITIDVVSGTTPTATPTPVPTPEPTATPSPQPTATATPSSGPTVSFATPANNENLMVGEEAYVQVLATDADGNIANVRLSLDGTFIRQENVSPYQWGNNSKDSALHTMAVGSHQLSAVATDNDGNTQTAVIKVNVVSNATPTPVPTATPTPGGNAQPTVSFTSPSNGDSFNWGDQIDVDVNASDSDGSISNVRLSVDGTFVRQENVVPYLWGSNAADAILHSLSVGDHQLTAVATDDSGASTTKNITISILESTAEGDCSISGTIEQWHRVEVLCSGYQASESDDTTFTDLRFDVTFSNGNTSIKVPGHFAADGDAANTGASSGDKWRAYFAPPTTGTWNYTVSFRQGSDIAVSTSNSAGSALSPLNGMSGSFNVNASSASGKDMRSRGLLQHNFGERYLRFAGDNSLYFEAGMDSPENIFGYSGFDNTTKYANVSACKGIIHDFAPHQDDWQAGDPTWTNSNKGKGLIGLVNYIASRNVNAVYIMTNTVNGDGCDAHPWTSYNSNGDVKSFDVSKLDQWEIVLGHMTAKGILIHVVTQETENDQLLNNGDLGLERKLYYRELISRFAHHPALQWNLGEETSNSVAQIESYADFIKALDPYNHPRFLHTRANETAYEDYYGALLGYDNFDGPTFQISNINETPGEDDGGVYGLTLDWQERAEAAGNPWIITFTEASGVQAPKPFSSVTERQRVYYMWANVMSGGAGFEWYLKNTTGGSTYDQGVEDLREFDEHWQQSGYIATFMQDTLQEQLGVDLHDLEVHNNLTSTSSDWVLADPGNVYIIYLREGGSTDLYLPDNSNYQVLWMNPRTGVYTNGGNLQGSGEQSIGNPPSEADEDWVAVVTVN